VLLRVENFRGHDLKISRICSIVCIKETTGIASAGSGLGLAIVKRILELHGSSIEVSSTIKVGTSFSFTLPIHKPRS
jgi:signal transduction histidine kinase